jgi:hypothetical protein
MASDRSRTSNWFHSSMNDWRRLFFFFLKKTFAHPPETRSLVSYIYIYINIYIYIYLGHVCRSSYGLVWHYSNNWQVWQNNVIAIYSILWKCRCFQWSIHSSCFRKKEYYNVSNLAFHVNFELQVWTVDENGLKKGTNCSDPLQL